MDVQKARKLHKEYGYRNQGIKPNKVLKVFNPKINIIFVWKDFFSFQLLLPSLSAFSVPDSYSMYLYYIYLYFNFSQLLLAFSTCFALACVKVQTFFCVFGVVSFKGLQLSILFCFSLSSLVFSIVLVPNFYIPCVIFLYPSFGNYIFLMKS